MNVKCTTVATLMPGVPIHSAAINVSVVRDIKGTGSSVKVRVMCFNLIRMMLRVWGILGVFLVCLCTEVILFRGSRITLYGNYKKLD